ncbi:MAG TPA: MBL fold metallo-hydrolase [Phycisphaerae bacterium]|nr:MBL fold metallo-hydrolase [Phycisphaerae bacterium]
MKPASKYMVCVVLATGVAIAGLMAQEKGPPKITPTRLTDHLYMLPGAGGEIAVSIGDDGTLLVDSGMAEYANKVAAAVKETDKAPIRCIINTHWHFDHVGGNDKLAAPGATIIAHENVRKRMSTDQYIANIDQKVPASPPAALPTTTYSDAMTLYWNGEEIQIIHLEPAHTDGDSLVYFRKANVLHTGDIFFAGQYPFMDVRAGGSIDGMIKGIDRALLITNEKTRIIPGHGPVSSQSDLRAYAQMLRTARDNVRSLVQQGKSRDEVIAAKPTRELDENWSHASFPPDMWVGIIFDGMTRK